MCKKGGPARRDEVWMEVDILEEAAISIHKPKLECRGCAYRFVGGITRIKEHLLVGSNSVMAQTCRLEPATG